ncbi:exonuclease 3'-5' domain-containing protein 2 [Prorops nasuta]|uniref:exonuclease 3'-5' domain-containing protein 2 n=1 Tax=Prorops nasuta TaxID=863751 RepID=UPI0034CD2000
MFQPRNNMFFVCVTVGLVFLASKYRDNVIRNVKKFCKNIKKAKDSNNNCTNNRNENLEKPCRIPLDKIILADSPEKCDYAVQRIRCNLSHGILGFDCEWVNEGAVSLVQLATFNGVCALFRIGKIGYIPPKLKELLASKQILKVGVASFEDGQKIIKDYGCRVFGTVDLRTLAQKLNLPSQKSLAALCLHYLGIEMDKVIEVRCGDWDATTLNDEQMAYAACDAIASVLIYHQILEQAKQKHPLWKKILSYIKSIWNKDNYAELHEIPEGVIDTRFREHLITAKNCEINNNQKSAPVINRINKDKLSNLPTRVKPLYDNCYLQAPDGEVLCTCDSKKAEWYISKGLGEVVNNNPFTVKLRFEPSGRALGNVGQYYTQIKVNQCVVCGASEKFIKKHVVPREYRKYFPFVMKAHQSHDILLLCPPCHEESKAHDLQLRRKLADACDAPLIGPKPIQNCRKLCYAVKALREVDTLPNQRRLELEKFVIKNIGEQDLSPHLLDALYAKLKNGPNISSQTTSQLRWQPHGLKVVQYFENREGGLVTLEQTWREHFLSTMKPKFLPNLWSISHNQQRLTIRQTQNRITPQDAMVAGIN